MSHNVQVGESGDTGTSSGPHLMLRWFEYEHLPPKLQSISRPFGELAAVMVAALDPGPELTVSVRKLLEAKDAAVRAALATETE